MTSREELGGRLRSGRTEQGLTLAVLSERTGLPESYLQALESGDYRALPNEVYARIYFINYARALGLDTEALMLEWPRPPEPEPVSSASGTAPARKRPSRIAIVVAAVVLVSWIVVQLTGDDEPADRLPGEAAPEAGGEPLPEVLAAEESTARLDTVAVTQPPPELNPDESIPTPPPVVSHSLTLNARGQTWIVVEADGDTVDARLIAAGTTVRAEALASFVLTVGRPQSVEILVDRQRVDLPVRPGRPLVRHRIAFAGASGP